MFFHKLFFMHKWKLIDTVNIVDPDDGYGVGKKFYLQCEVCGNIKRKKAKY